MAHDAFLSYSAKDKVIADAACATLEAAGIRCWIAPRDVAPGTEWGEAIIGAIEESRVMVLIFSANANESFQIRREVERAVSKGIAVMPMRIEDVAPGRALEFFIGSVHWLDALTPPVEEHLHRLAKAVGALLQAQTGTTPSVRAGLPLHADAPTTKPVGGVSAPARTETAAEQARPREAAEKMAEEAGRCDAAARAAEQDRQRKAAEKVGMDAQPGAAGVKKSNRLPRWAPAAIGLGVSIILAIGIQQLADEPDPPKQEIVSSTEAFNRGLQADRRQDYAEAMRWYRQAADQGDASAESNIGFLYNNGQGVTRDYAAAMQWYSKAADQGNAMAQNNIGALYDNGQGVTRDYAVAMQWYSKAANQGNAIAQRNIGVLYANGQGVTRDLNQARAWMQKAAAGGDEDAKKWLAAH